MSITPTRKSASPRKPAPFKLTMPEVPESAILNACLQFLNYHPLVAWAVRMNTGAATVARKDGTEQFVRFGFKGLGDIMGQMKDGRLLMVETKARTGRLRPDQRAVLLHVQKHNGVAGVARSIEDVAAILAGRIFDPEVHK